MARTPAAMIEARGRVVALSGAARGLGAAIARRLSDDGFTLALGVRDPRAAAKLGLPRTRTSIHAFDALEPDSAPRWIAEVVKRHGRLDALVNNAGILRRVTLEEGSEEDLDAMWAVNVKAPFRLIRTALPHLRRAGAGRIVNIASTDGKRIRDTSVSIGYAMTKHALVALSQAAKLAGWPDGVRTTALCPGAIETDMLAGLPGITPGPGWLKPETVAEIVSLLLRLPNTATIAELVVNTRQEHSY